MDAIFKKTAKKSKIFEKFGKNVQNLKIFSKRELTGCVNFVNTVCPIFPGNYEFFNNGKKKINFFIYFIYVQVIFTYLAT